MFVEWYQAGRTGLLGRNAIFRRLWAAQTVSVLGDAVTVVALPSVAILTLHASAPAVGALNAAGWSAWAVFGLVAGVWVDRLSRRPLLVGTDLLRLVLIGSVPVAWIFGVLTIWQLLAVAAIIGTCSVVFGLAYTSYVPDAVAAEDLTEANARLELSNSAAFLSGPSLAGVLISAAGAPTALVVDAASFALSALMLGRGRGAPARAARRPRRRFRAELGEGIRELRARPALLRVALAGAVANFGFAMVQAVLFVYAFRTLHLSAAVVGGALTIGAAGTVTGALQAQRLTRQLGTARSLFVSTVRGELASLFLPLGLLGLPAVALAVSSRRAG